MTDNALPASIDASEVPAWLDGLNPPQKQAVLTNGILAVMSRDPAFVASLFKQMTDRAPPRTAATTRPLRQPGPGGRRPPG